MEEAIKYLSVLGIIVSLFLCISNIRFACKVEKKMKKEKFIITVEQGKLFCSKLYVIAGLNFCLLLSFAVIATRKNILLGLESSGILLPMLVFLVAVILNAKSKYGRWKI